MVIYRLKMVNFLVQVLVRTNYPYGRQCLGSEICRGLNRGGHWGGGGGGEVGSAEIWCMGRGLRIQGFPSFEKGTRSVEKRAGRHPWGV